MTKAVWLRLRRALKYVAVSACAVALFIALAVSFRINLANKWEVYSPIRSLSIDQLGKHILIFTTHPDDETLGCGGLIALAKENGAKVKVVAITNGDAYRVAAARSYRTPRVTAGKCISFGKARQLEMLRAMAVLGLDKESMVFLGYPDRGIAKLWQNNWTRDEAFTSAATKRSYVFDSRSPSRGKAYCGQNLMDDIIEILREERPTDVFFAHPRDNHSDHYATSCFVLSALVQLEGHWGQGAHIPRMWEFVVHRGDWPYYSGQSTKDKLSPPFSLSREGDQWYSLDLGPQVAELKKKAILQYKSQLAIERGFMMGFARRNEVFTQIKNEQITDDSRAIAVDGRADDWNGVVPAVINPVNDTLLADLGRSGDVRAVYVLHRDGKLYLRFDTAGRISKRVIYMLQLRLMRDDMRLADMSLVVRKLQVQHRPRELGPRRWAWRGHCLESEFDVPELKAGDVVWLRASSKLSRLSIDDTGWQSLEVR